MLETADFPETTGLRANCAEGQLIITRQWVRLENKEPGGGWALLRAAISMVAQLPDDNDDGGDEGDGDSHTLVLHTPTSERRVHRVTARTAATVRELLACPVMEPPVSLLPAGAVPHVVPPVLSAVPTAPTVPMVPTLPGEWAARAQPERQASVGPFYVACQGGLLFISEERVSLAAASDVSIARAAVAGVSVRPRSANRVDLAIFAETDRGVKAVILAPAVATQDALPVVARLGPLAETARAAWTPPDPRTLSVALAPQWTEPLLRVVVRPEVLSSSELSAIVEAPEVARVAEVAEVPITQVAAPLPAPAVVRKRRPARQASHLRRRLAAWLTDAADGMHAAFSRATRRRAVAVGLLLGCLAIVAANVSLAQAAPTPTGPLAWAPVPVTLTCAEAVNQVEGRICVHTQPGAALQVYVNYCGGFSDMDASPQLQGIAHADAQGNYTWDWVPAVACNGIASIRVTVEAAGYHDVYWFSMSASR